MTVSEEYGVHTMEVAFMFNWKSPDVYIIFTCIGGVGNMHSGTKASCAYTRGFMIAKQIKFQGIDTPEYAIATVLSVIIAPCAFLVK